MRRLPTPVRVALALVLLQALAVVGYRAVEGRRRAARPAAFRAERVAVTDAPDLDLERASGERFTLASLRGRPVVLHFWASWCAPCRDELPSILELGRRLEREGATLVAVSLDADWEAVRRFVGAEPSPAIARGRGGIPGYDLAALPETYVVGADGKLRLRVSGPRDWSSAEATRALADAWKGVQSRD